MADSTIDSELIYLYDRWAGYPIRSEVPAGGFDGSAHHNVAAAKYKIGEKIAVYNESLGVPGLSTFVYLGVGTQNGASLLAVKSFCIPDSATLYYLLTNDPDHCIKIPTPLGCVAISAMTDAYYGWFWCGGVVPEEYISTLGGNYTTDGNVAAGGFIFHDGAADYVNISIADTAPEVAAGFALAADV